MSTLNSSRENYLIIVGSYNQNFNKGLSLYKFNHVNKEVLDINKFNQIINPIHLKISQSPYIVYAACAQTKDNGVIAVLDLNRESGTLNLIKLIN